MVSTTRCSRSSTRCRRGRCVTTRTSLRVCAPFPPTSINRSSLHARAAGVGLCPARHGREPDDRSGGGAGERPVRPVAAAGGVSDLSRATSAQRSRIACALRRERHTQQQFVPSWKRLETFLRDTYQKVARQVRPGPGLSTAVRRASVRQPDSQLHDDEDGGERNPSTRPRLKSPASSARWRVWCAQAGFTGTVAEFERRLASRSRDALLDAGRDAPVRARGAGPRRAAAAASVQTNATDDGRRAADSRGSRGVDGIELHGGHGRWNAARLVQHEHLQARRTRRSTRSKRSSCTRPCQGITCRSGSHASSRGCLSSARCSVRRRFRRGGRYMPNRLAQSSVCIAIRRRGSGSWRASGFAPCVSSSIPASMRWDGRATVRASTFSSTCRRSRSPRSTATSHGRVRRSLTSSGSSKIKRLRRKAEQALGARFDVRDFHDAVLRNGALPLDLLEPQVDAVCVQPRTSSAESQLQTRPSVRIRRRAGRISLMRQKHEK